MDCAKVGNLIYKLRKEKNLTQKQLADAMNISDRTISKWERGIGIPDVSLLSELSSILHVNIREILSGDLMANERIGGNMKKLMYYVCPFCGNMMVGTGNISVSCCGRNLEACIPQKASEEQKLSVEIVEDEFYITSDHPMTKDHYISFVAFATGERVQIVKHDAEWNLQTRMPKRGGGTLIWHCTKDGLFYQLL